MKKYKFLVDSYGRINTQVKKIEESLNESLEFYNKCNKPFNEYIEEVKKHTIVKTEKDIICWREKQEESKKNTLNRINELKQYIEDIKKDIKEVQANKNQFVYKSGKILIKIDLKNKCFNTLNFEDKTYKDISFKEVEEVAKNYKGSNVLHKPFTILLYQQEVKTSRYNIEPNFIIAENETLNDLLNKYN